MALRPATSALAFTARLDAAQVSRAMAGVRAGIGAVGLLAPGRLAWRLFLQDKQIDEATALVLRAAAARDLALGDVQVMHRTRQRAGRPTPGVYGRRRMRLPVCS